MVLYCGVISWPTDSELTSLLACVSAYDGPYENSPDSPESHVTGTKITVLNVTPDSAKTEETDSDNDIPTIPTGSRRVLYSDLYKSVLKNCTSLKLACCLVSLQCPV